MLLGSTPDISVLLQYHFYEKVYYSIAEKYSFPSKSTEKIGYFVGVSENAGDALTYKELTEDTQKIFSRSAIRSANDPETTNRRVDPDRGRVTPISQLFLSNPKALVLIRVLVSRKWLVFDLMIYLVVLF